MFYFVDFDDSFSNNILCELYSLDIHPEVIHWKTLVNTLVYKRLPKGSTIILGPGPGHPSEYSSIYPAIEHFSEGEFKLIGICLGHQLLAIHNKFECISAQEIKHGVTELIPIDSLWQNIFNTIDKSIEVQRYNSLAITDQETSFEKLVFNNEVVALKGASLLSMQFHPESIGTKNRDSFFKGMASL